MFFPKNIRWIFAFSLMALFTGAVAGGEPVLPPLPEGWTPPESSEDLAGPDVPVVEIPDVAEAPRSPGSAPAAAPETAALSPWVSGCLATPSESESGLIDTIGEQPQGALSGVVVYTSAGHGFGANEAETAWITERGLLYSVNEDIGNIDQFNYFAEAAWKAGATVVPFRPLGHQTNEVVLDNTDTNVSSRGQVTYGGVWNNTAQTNIYYGKTGDVGYRYTALCLTGTTAWASYRPTIPAAGEYPVYTWVRSGSDRANQLYRVRHAGGVTDIRVDHSQVGNGWVWLGNYYFEQGTNGCVEISNYSPGGTAGAYVFADAIRFGNGMGSAARGTAGISGFEQELESSRFWVIKSMGVGMDSGLYDLSGYSDSEDNIGQPARWANAMCRTNGWPRWRRIYVGFHSNAGSGSGRGTWGLYDTRLTNYPAYYKAQTNLAKKIALRSYADLSTAASNGIVSSWSAPSLWIYGSTYGEIYNASVYLKMDTTINEVGFHDNESDAEVLRTPAGREWLARATVRGVIEHLGGYYVDSEVPVVFAPDRPQNVQSKNTAPGEVTLSWAMPSRTAASGDLPTGFAVYRSPDGLAFGNPIAVPGADTVSCVLTGLTPGITIFFRVCATNAGGESLHSAVAGAGVASNGRAAALVVDGFKRNDDSLAPVRYFANNLNGNVALVRPDLINARNYVKEHGGALAVAGQSFDYADNDVVTYSLLTNYVLVIWMLGEESTVDETFSAAEQSVVTNYLAHGGRMMISGAEIGWDLMARGASADAAFMTNGLHTGYVRDSGGQSTVAGTAGGALSGLVLHFNHTNLLQRMYAAEYPDVLKAGSGATVAAVYGSSPSGPDGAVIQFSNEVFRVVVMGFPFETITNAAERAALMERVVLFLANDAADTNGNGLPDAWEVECFGAVTNVAAADDYDGDGLSNYGEYIAGTHPAQAHSFLSVEEAAADETGESITLRWSSVSGRTYSVWLAPSVTAAFERLTDELAATPPANSWTNAANAVTSGYYRIRATRQD